jgi:ring-1,2-phenylacetyl-CoA epoxidase subunit PaaE
VALHFHQLRVKEIRRETNDCISVAFEVPGTLQELFTFRQGQNLTVKAVINGEEVRRSYSICSCPLDQELRIAIKRVEGGLFSTWANETLQPGTMLEVMPPSGKFFTELHPDQTKNYLAIAAGSGITPILSIIKTTLLTEPNSSFTLVFGNRNRSSIIFKEDLEALKNRFLDRFSLVHVLSREIMETPVNSGRIDEEKIRQLEGKLINLQQTDEVFICGPESMIRSVSQFLEQRGFPVKKIHYELFTIPGQSSSQKNTQTRVNNSGPSSAVTVKLDGISFNFYLPYGSAAILDAALQQGADLPFACKGGVCATCKAKLTEGKVTMEHNYSLEPDELAEGFILTCQAHPASEKVTIDFDVR